MEVVNSGFAGFAEWINYLSVHVVCDVLVPEPGEPRSWHYDSDAPERKRVLVIT